MKKTGITPGRLRHTVDVVRETTIVMANEKHQITHEVTMVRLMLLNTGKNLIMMVHQVVITLDAVPVVVLPEACQANDLEWPSQDADSWHVLLHVADDHRSSEDLSEVREFPKDVHRDVASEKAADQNEAKSTPKVLLKVDEAAASQKAVHEVAAVENAAGQELAEETVEEVREFRFVQGHEAVAGKFTTSSF